MQVYWFEIQIHYTEEKNLPGYLVTRYTTTFCVRTRNDENHKHCSQNTHCSLEANNRVSDRIRSTFHPKRHHIARHRHVLRGALYITK